METNETTYGIWASVSGGVTGSRAAWLKSDGKIRTFDSKTEAEKVAAHLCATMGLNSKATFNYVVREFDGV